MVWAGRDAAPLSLSLFSLVPDCQGVRSNSVVSKHRGQPLAKELEMNKMWDVVLSHTLT